MASSTTTPLQADEAAITVPVHQEALHVDTRAVDTGSGVRVHKRVHHQPEAIVRELAHDELEVQRVPVGRIVAELPATRYEGETLVVPVLEEVLVVEKRYRIKEEVRITRHRRHARHETAVEVRSEEVTVERFSDTPPITQAERKAS